MKTKGARSMANKTQSFRNLLGNKCAVCGISEDLQFDHIDPSTKSFNITGFLYHPDIMAELAKCQLLCKPHHLEKSKTEAPGRPPVEHGGGKGGKKGCKCEPCREKRNAYYREWYSKNGRGY